MRWQAASAAFLLLAMLSGCGDSGAADRRDPAGPTVVQPGMGSNEVFREMLSAAPGHELIVADLALGPDAVGEAHSHPWEEYLYVLGGSAVLDVEGAETQTLGPGETAVIPATKVHTPRAGPEGIRAIVLRVHDEGDPLSIPAGEPQATTAGS